MLTNLNLGVQKDLDPDRDNLVAAGTFAYGSMQSPMKVKACPEVSEHFAPRAKLCEYNPAPTKSLLNTVLNFLPSVLGTWKAGARAGGN